jgi:hypothetical protein
MHPSFGEPHIGKQIQQGHPAIGFKVPEGMIQIEEQVRIAFAGGGINFFIHR